MHEQQQPDPEREARRKANLLWKYAWKGVDLRQRVEGLSPMPLRDNAPLDEESWSQQVQEAQDTPPFDRTEDQNNTLWADMIGRLMQQEVQRAGVDADVRAVMRETAYGYVMDSISGAFTYQKPNSDECEVVPYSTDHAVQLLAEQWQHGPTLQAWWESYKAGDAYSFGLDSPPVRERRYY